MFYIDNNMIKSGLSTDIITPEQFSSFLKSILIDGAEIAKPDSINGDTLTFNNGYKINDGLSIVEITDGNISFNIRLQQIDMNNVKSDRDLSSLNLSKAIIKTPKVTGWDYEENATHYIFHNGGASFEINKNLSGKNLSTNCIRGVTSTSGVGQQKLANGNIYIIYNNHGFSLFYEYAVGWSGLWGFHSNEDSTNFLEYSININWRALKSSVLFLDGINKNALQSDYINTNQSFNDNRGAFSLFALTGGGLISNIFLNSSGNLKNSFNDGANLVQISKSEKVIILKNRAYYMGLAYDDSVY